MSAFIVLDIALGLAFVYLGVAVITSMLVEFLAAWRNWRGNFLREGVAWLLGGEAGRTLHVGPPSFAWCRPQAQQRTELLTAALHPGIKALLERVQNHPLLSGSRLVTTRAPSYVPARQFALALIDSLVGERGSDGRSQELRLAINNLPEGALRSRLLSLARDDRAGSLQAIIEQDFDAAMDRVTGWYKRRTQKAILLLAFVVAGVLNIDTFRMVRTLWHEPASREIVASYVEGYAKRCPATADGPSEACKNESLEAMLGKAELLSVLPVGWRTESDTSKSERKSPATGSSSQPRDLQPVPASGWFVALPGQLCMVAGWLVTALAASLGAPFWFDSLSKLVALRSAGRKPAASAGEVTPASSQLPSRIAPFSANSSAITGVLPLPPTSMEECLSRDDIRAIQIALGRPKTLASGEIDSDTRAALRERQALMGRAQTGLADPETVRELLTES